MCRLFRTKLLLFGLLIVSIATQKSSSYQFTGCFLEDNLLSLGQESRVLTQISPKSCSEFCSEKKYIFFFLKNENCYCNKNYISKLMRQFDHECTIKCAGDQTASCGGAPNLVSSYITDSTKLSNFIAHGGYPIPIYLGCFSETPGDDEIRLLKGPAQPYNNNTPEKCSEICFKMGYLYFGVTYGSECWCGNQKPSKLAKVEDSNCNSACSGDSSQFCGGGWKIGIYSTGITDYTPKKYLGCFEDNDSKPKGKYLSFQMDTNNSPKRCVNLCNTLQLKYAVLKGNVCECKISEPNYNLKRHFADCKTPCKGNPIEYCGGSTSSSVYKTLYSDQREVMSLKHIGCFNNFKRHPVISGWSKEHSQLTPQHCVRSCYARRLPYAALVSSKECLCSSIKPSNEAKIADNMCMIPCSGSSQEKCGGYNAMNVYSTGLEWRTDTIGNHYLGCYEENENMRIFNGYSNPFSINTPAFCSNLCLKYGYSYSGVTYKSECFCGNLPPSNKFTKVEDKQCNTKCSGDANQFCGGGWKMGVFATGLYDFPIEDRFVGCFIQQEYSFSNMEFELINTNTPDKCSTICYNAGYNFAGVTGIKCFCGDRAPENGLNAAVSDCDINCVGDPSKTCGGEDRIQIYDLDKVIHTNEIPSLPELIEEFDSLNLNTLWSHEVYIAQDPDFEFVIYNNSERNTYVKNGELIIKPTIQSDNFIKKGCLVLKGCTKSESTGCAMNASSFYIIPPIVSAKITTKHNLFFLYGQLEVVAKLPTGDWIVSEIALVSKSNEQNRLVLAMSFGNTDLKCNGNDESSSVLNYGLKIDEHYNLKSKMMKSTIKRRWSDDYHTFVLSWTPQNIVFTIDGESNNLDTSNLSLEDIFSSEYYVSIGMSVGGMKNFQDGCLSNGHLKPWRNFETKALLNFWKDKTHWSSTWDEERTSLRVKSVKFTATNRN